MCCVLLLQSVSLTIEPGEVVALVGPSGGGKSTSVGLIEHFYEPTEGTVLLDGIPVEQYSHSYLHSKVSTGIPVEQYSTLVEGASELEVCGICKYSSTS